jgi:hypothetical protein
MDELGRVIYSGTYELKEGEQLISLDLSNLSGAGMHILLIRSSEGVEMKKIIKL